MRGVRGCRHAVWELHCHTESTPELLVNTVSGMRRMGEVAQAALAARHRQEGYSSGRFEALGKGMSFH